MVSARFSGLPFAPGFSRREQGPSSRGIARFSAASRPASAQEEMKAGLKRAETIKRECLESLRHPFCRDKCAISQGPSFLFSIEIPDFLLLTREGACE